LRIAYVSDCYWPRINGVTVALQTYKDELRKRGHEVLIICPNYASTNGSRGREESVKRLAAQSTPFSKEDRLVKPTALPAMFRALDKFKPDVIHINSEFTVAWMGVIYSKLRGHPILITSHTDWEDYVCNYIPHVDRRLLRAFVRFLLRALFRNADVLVVPSRSQMRILRGYHLRNRYVVVPSGVSSLFVKRNNGEVAAYRASLDARFPALAGKRILLFAGRIADEKDPKFLLPVLSAVQRCRSDVALVFAGDGPGRPRVEGSARRRGLDGSCVFLGYIPSAELSLLYGAASVFVFPSKTETLGLCTIEAMSSGLPVVAVGEMGTRDVMKGDNGGFMVGNDVREFSDAVMRLLDDDELRARKSDEAVAWARRYGPDAMIERILRLYRLIADRRARVLKVRSGIP
jgi:1,2-diacylglycerol 3-alpha-glucosyltransferase